MIEIIIAGFFGYLMGSILISYFLAQLKGIDLTKEGTGQLGASNAGRVLGWPVMILLGLFDILKATLALLMTSFILTNFLDSPYIEVSLISTSCGLLIGHINSFWIWLHKHEWCGGKGAAPFGGIILFFSWESFIVLYIILIPILQLSKKKILKNRTFYDNFLVNFITAICAPFVVFWFSREFLYIVLILMLEGIMAYFEKEKLTSILLAKRFKQKNVLNIKRTS